MEQAANRALKKITHSTALKAAMIIAALGLAAFWSGLSNDFVADDLDQIVKNPIIQSTANIPLLFRGGTFYNGGGIAPMGGVYYRPLMTTAYALLYSNYGADPFAFHLFQLLLHIASTFFLFLVLKYFLRPWLALALSLVFLVHPMNTQAVYYSAALQEPLFFFFGILGLWTLIKFQDKPYWYLALPAVCLLLSLFSKESGVLFVGLLLVYAFITDRRRFLILGGVSILLVAFYLTMKVHAVGLVSNPNNAPIDRLNIWGRLLNAPAIIWFYLSKAFWPWQQANGYYWAYNGIGIEHFVLPLVLDLIIVGLVAYAARFLYNHRERRHFLLFMFFSAWLILGLLLHIQIVPLDFTACETWFYFPLAGLLGMLGVLIEATPLRLPKSQKWLAWSISTAIVALLIVPTVKRAQDWTDIYTLCHHDVTVSEEDYNCQNVIAYDLLQKHKPEEAKTHAKESVRIFPTYSSYGMLGEVLFALGDFPGAKQADLKGISYRKNVNLYEQLAAVSLWYGDPQDYAEFFKTALAMFPQDPTLWLSYAQLEYKGHDIVAAQAAVARAVQYGSGDQYTYNAILNQQTLNLTTGELSQSINP